MPELPEVEAVRRTLDRAMRGSRIARVELRRPDLRRPFPSDFAARLTGQVVEAVTRRGKYLLAQLRSGDTLIAHLGMSGSFRTARCLPLEHLRCSRGRDSALISAPVSDHAAGDPEADAHDHVVLELSSGAVVTFNDPRRFGLMDLVAAGDAPAHDAIGALGPEPLDDAFDAAVLARACAGKRVSLKLALLDQRLVAGVGNIYASEALHHARLSPRRRASTIATRAGAPREAAVRLAAGIKTVLRRAIARQEQAYRAGRFRVYERDGQPCLRRGCPGTIRRITQAGRSTYDCPTCQR